MLIQVAQLYILRHVGVIFAMTEIFTYLYRSQEDSDSMFRKDHVLECKGKA